MKPVEEWEYKILVGTIPKPNITNPWIGERHRKLIHSLTYGDHRNLQNPNYVLYVEVYEEPYHYVYGSRNLIRKKDRETHFMYPTHEQFCYKATPILDSDLRDIRERAWKIGYAIAESDGRTKHQPLQRGGKKKRRKNRVFGKWHPFNIYKSNEVEQWISKGGLTYTA